MRSQSSPQSREEVFTTPSHCCVSSKTSLVSESVCIIKSVLIENAFEKQSDSVTALRSDFLAPLLLPLAPLAVWMVASLSFASVSSSFLLFSLLSLPVLKNPHRESRLLRLVANKRRGAQTFEVGGTMRFGFHRPTSVSQRQKT